MFKFIFLFLVSFNCFADGLPDLSGLDDINNQWNTLELSSGNYSSKSGSRFDPWSDADVKREAVMIGVTTIDWLQTRNIARHNCTNPSTGEHNCYESGPAASFIGKHPSIGQVNNYFALSMLAHVGIVSALPSKYRSVFQLTSIVYEASYVAGNYQIGISVKF
jgi:hypothetical protein